MSNYKVIGKRFLKKYTAANLTPVYSSEVDVQEIVRKLCDVPWEAVSVRDAQMTYHTEEKVSEVSGLDYNVQIRDSFDAALFCAEHKSGHHRAYANAAVYVYELPDAAVGVTLNAIKLSVTSDPYNSHGARIHVMTNSTGDIPTNCRVVRGENDDGEIIEDGTTASGVAPRTTRTVSGQDYWYPTIEDCTLEPIGGLTLQKYLMVYVGMESYATVRGNWIEGCSFMANLADMTTATPIPGWTDGSTVDATPEDAVSSIVVVKNRQTVDLDGAASGVVSVAMTSSGVTPIFDDGRHVDDLNRVISGSNSDNIEATVRNVYRRFLDGNVEVVDFANANPLRRSCGVGFCVSQVDGIKYVNSAGAVAEARTVILTASSLLVPFSVPESLSASRVKFDWHAWLAGRTPTAASKFVFWFRPESVTEFGEDVVKNPKLYNATGEDVDGWTLLGVVPCYDGEALFQMRQLPTFVGTFLVTAYVQQSSVFDTSEPFAIGSAKFWYNGMTADEELPVSPSVYKPFDHEHVYQPGEVMRYVSAGNAVIKRIIGVDSPLSRYRFLVGDVVCGFKPGESVIMSFDGIHFSSCDMTIDSQVQYTAFLGRPVVGPRYVVRSATRIYTSIDGLTWTSQDRTITIDGVDYGIEEVAYGNGLFVATDGHFIFRSADFETWSVGEEYANVNSPKFCGSWWIANIDGAAKRSTDGVSWQSMTGISQEYRRIACRDNYAVLISEELSPKVYATSSSGAIWNVVETADEGVDVICVGDIWLVLTFGAVYRSVLSTANFVKVHDLVNVTGERLLFNGSYFLVVTSGSCLTAEADGSNFVVKDVAIRAGSGIDAFGGVFIALEGNVQQFYDDGDSRSAYVATVKTSGSFSEENFSLIESPVRERLVGIENLCIPDITLLG